MGDEETALAANAHPIEAGVPSGDHLVRALLEDEWAHLRVFGGGVEYGAVLQIAGVEDAVPLVRRGRLASSDLGIDVGERESDRIDAEILAHAGGQGRRRVAGLHRRDGGQGVYRLGAGCASGQRRDLG